MPKEKKNTKKKSKETDDEIYKRWLRKWSIVFRRMK